MQNDDPMRNKAQAAPRSNLEALKTLLANTEIRLASNPDINVVDELAAGLAVIHDRAIADGELQVLKSAVEAHPIHGAILADPYSRRAFDKPRGYAGDAVMLDFIYRPQDVQLDEAGKAVHRGTTQLPTAQSVLWRREYLADLILRSMQGRESVSMLSVASGHMRELELVRERTARRDLRVTALDQDQDSIAECIQSYGADFEITPIGKSLTHIIKGGLREETFDLVYSAGLFDYLSDRVAVALVRQLYKHLKPGAILSVGNFVPDNHGRGFMEFLMDWSLVKRTEDDMLALAGEACPGAKVRTFLDEPRNVAYFEITAS
jgi:extracellular factor (EF) 3-hydroxypalmitic acid methyl ester biosynthesis protein